MLYYSHIHKACIAAAMPREYPVSPQLTKGIWYKVKIDVPRATNEKDRETALITVALCKQCA